MPKQYRESSGFGPHGPVKLVEKEGKLYKSDGFGTDWAPSYEADPYDETPAPKQSGGSSDESNTSGSGGVAGMLVLTAIAGVIGLVNLVIEKDKYTCGEGDPPTHSQKYLNSSASWDEYSCKTKAEYGSGWSKDCLRRTEFQGKDGKKGTGCPGTTGPSEERCCP